MNLLPPITFLTVLDKQQLYCFAIILATTFETTALGSILDCGVQVTWHVRLEPYQ